MAWIELTAGRPSEPGGSTPSPACPWARFVLSEIAVTTAQNTLERFILEWGDMGAHWGVNRSIGQIQALLYLAEAPMNAEQIAETLGLARSNVSTSLRELQGWGLIRRVPLKGDRREHFEAETDVWEIAARIAAGRKAREIDPALATLRACVVAADSDPAVGATARQRLRAMLDFTETCERWYAQMLSVPRGKLLALVRLGARIAALLPDGSKTKR
jgi:DNA-binding transcriptional regulator GbsR (MarR family)